MDPNVDGVEDGFRPVHLEVASAGSGDGGDLDGDRDIKEVKVS